MSQNVTIYILSVTCVRRRIPRFKLPRSKFAKTKMEMKRKAIVAQLEKNEKTNFVKKSTSLFDVFIIYGQFNHVASFYL